MKGLINIQKDYNELFRWCLVRYINPVNKIYQYLKTLMEKFQNKGIIFPVQKVDHKN